jgi:hypothetical protein
METVMNKVNEVLDEIGETIGMLIDGHTIEEQEECQEDFKEKCDEIVELVEETYILVSWPDSQEYMDEEWFDEEAVLHPNEPSAYFIPTKYA